MNAQQFTQEEQASFVQALRYGLDYISTLNGYQKARLADLAREKQYRAVQVHTERFERHPYAPQQAGQLNYWLDSAPAYVEGQQVLTLLAEPAPTVTSLAVTTAPVAIEAPSSLSLRQVAIFYYYSAKPLTENNAASIAASEGHKSKTSGKQLVDKYIEFCELLDSELPTNLKALTHLEKALTGLLPRLEGEAKQNATNYLEEVIDKKKRGF